MRGGLPSGIEITNGEPLQALPPFERSPIKVGTPETRTTCDMLTIASVTMV